eukprot:2487771-Pleurochrysis_carterae.AAC.1
MSLPSLWRRALMANLSFPVADEVRFGAWGLFAGVQLLRATPCSAARISNVRGVRHRMREG